MRAVTSGHWLAAAPTALAGWIARIVTAACQLLTVRILSESLGVDGFAAYVTVASLQSWFLLSDLGYGSAIQNHTSQSRVRGIFDPLSMTGALLLLLGLGLLVALTFMAASILLGPLLLRNFSSIDSDQAMLGLGLFGAVGVGTGAANIAFRLLFAEHRGYIAHAATAAAAVLGTIGVYLLWRLRVPEPLALSLLASYLPLFLLPLALLLGKMDPSALAQPRATLKKGRDLLSNLWDQARGFLLFAALAACVLNIDYLVMAQLFEPDQILIYTIATRFLGLFFVLYFSFTQASWPMSAEIITRGTTKQLPRLIQSCIAVGVIAVVAGGGALFMFPELISNLIAPGKSVNIPASVAALITLYWLVRVWCDTFSMVIMSSGDLAIMRVVVPVQAVINGIFLIVGARLYGLEGLILGSTLSFVLTGVWMFPLKVRAIMSENLKD